MTAFASKSSKIFERMAPYVTVEEAPLERVLLNVALLLAFVGLSGVMFTRDARVLRRVKTQQAIRIWEQTKFHESVEAVDDRSVMTNEQAQLRAMEIDAFTKKRTRSNSFVVLSTLALNHRVFSLFVQEPSYSRGPTLLLELISCLFTVALLQVRVARRESARTAP